MTQQWAHDNIIEIKGKTNKHPCHPPSASHLSPHLCVYVLIQSCLLISSGGQTSLLSGQQQWQQLPWGTAGAAVGLVCCVPPLSVCSECK